ncbi:Redoxin [Suhomyces tanzawaensis NRRL Y-17324]|uniref:Redoxin n=1 Tax=Suhomyces tanzawaensis NRRL Y-17324 TaxID=984487 RepID=A0A1E4SJN9_9ASCO|nr:Redoxin [Suhomyces tanzawaensis NRRL Y-17324]ODV79723.1 Redoxin [Suhomyces tanzawaensis NRRL Y-17324]
MSFQEGDQFPKDVTFTHVPIDLATVQTASALACEIPTPLKLDKLFDQLADTSSPNVVIVSVPGAFTPTCTENHIPPYLTHLAALKNDKKVGALIIISANDAFVLNAWGKLLIKNEASVSASGDYPRVIFASDPAAKFSAAHDLSVDASANGMGIRTARYGLVVDAKSRKIKYLGKEVERGVKHSGYEAVTSKL